MWGNWSDAWSTCSASCGDSGIQTKTRSKIQEPVNGGIACNGQANKSQECNRKINCPGTEKKLNLI